MRNEMMKMRSGEKTGAPTRDKAHKETRKRRRRLDEAP